MDEKKRIKDIYNCEYSISEGEVYPLQSWYAQLISKNLDELEVLDVVRMIRQNEFLDLAIFKAINYLNENTFVGDMYDGEVLENLSKLNIRFLIKYINELDNILKKALEENESHEWLCEEEKDEFEELVRKFLKKINIGSYSLKKAMD